VTDFDKQIKNLKAGLSVMNNISVLELHLIHNTKENMQEAMYDLE
jgi:hypothetical protein